MPVYDPALHLIADDPSVRVVRFVTSVAHDLLSPPEETGLDQAGWDAVRAHNGLWVNGRLPDGPAEAGAGLAVYSYASPPVPLELPPNTILFERDGVLAANKPSGLSTQRTRVSDQRCLEALLREATGDPELRAAHRLDRDTSGVVLFARTGQDAAALHAEFRLRRARKFYQAVVTPPSAEERFTVTGHLYRLAAPSTVPAPLKFGLGPGPEGKASETHFQQLEVRGDRALFEARPITGRTHQLRVHLASRGHPICGDNLYGDRESAARMLLHAARLELAIGGKLTEVEAPPPAGFWPPLSA
jgi:23S rRNA pseudouridine1911/1915/1917 synthase